MARSLRHSKIIELIRQKDIDTQEELCKELIASGFTVTQATVSRDVKLLGLLKVTSGGGKYKYVFVEGDKTSPDKVINLFRECVVSIRTAKNLVLVKTLSGNGSSAGMSVDKLSYPEVLGSVAGDDTLLIVTDSDENAEYISKKLGELLR